MGVKAKMKRLLVSHYRKDYASGVNQEPVQMQSCEPPAALNVLLWPVAPPKIASGVPPLFHSFLLSNTSAKPLIRLPKTGVASTILHQVSTNTSIQKITRLI
jgi:hypothetical protein